VIFIKVEMILFERKTIGFFMKIMNIDECSMKMKKNNRIN